MKIFKKIRLGIGLLTLFTIAFQFALPSSALAAGGPFAGSSDWRQATYEANSTSVITVSFPNKDHDAVKFTDSSPADKTYNFVADTNGTGVCSGSITFSKGQSFNTKPSITATISGRFMNGASPTPSCNPGDSIPGQDGQASQTIKITNNTNGGQPADTGPKTITYKGDTYTQIDTGSYKTVYGASTNLGKCYDGSLIVLAKADSKANAPVTGTLVNIGGPILGGGELISKHVPYWPVNNNPAVAGLGTCVYEAGSNGQDDLMTIAADGTATFKCSTTDGSTCAASTTPPPGGSTDPTGSCESNFNSPFGWIFCPAFKIADEAANQFNSFVQDQLCFNTGPTSSTSGFICGGNNNLNSGVHNAWNIFKNIASALLVIALLVMIISQAVGGGPFEAYTVRKMLPKLVAATIIMQLSWPLLKWVIDLSNDAGSAISSIMLAPFGGSSKLTLDHLLTVNLGTHTTTTNNEFSFFVVLAAGVGALALSIPGLAMMALYVVLALLTAFVVLIFRKLLIILLVILAPIAFIAWVLPGTDRYWKMWRENLTKLILMFPMIMGLIAAGKIFASITAGTSATILLPHLAVTHVGALPVPYFGSVTNFVNFAIIVGAYFAPFFMLPQTFKWGGAAMGAIANGVQKGVEKGAKPAKDYLQWRKGLSPWAQARAARKAEVERRSKLGFYEGLGANGVRGSIRRARLAGVETPGNYREIRDAITRRGRQQVEAEETKAAQEELLLELNQAANHDQFVRDVALGNSGATWTDVYGNSHAIGERSEWQRVAALGELARLGGAGNMRVIEEAQARAMASTDGRDRELYKKFLDSNASTLLPKMRHLYYGGENPGGVQATIEGLKPSNITEIDGTEMETLLGHLTTEMSTHAPGSAEFVRAQRNLSTLISTYYQAATSEETRTNISPAVSRAIKAVVDGTNLAGINENRLVWEMEPDPASPGSLRRRIDPVTHNPIPVMDPATGAQRILPGNPLIADRAYDPATGATTPLGAALIAADPTLATALGHLHTHVNAAGNVSP